MQQENNRGLSAKFDKMRMSYICNINEIKEIFLHVSGNEKDKTPILIICCNCNRKI